MMKDDPAEHLRQLGEAGEGPHDVARAALMLSALDHSGRPIEPYEAHLAEIAQAAKTESRLIARVEDGARALAALMVGRTAMTAIASLMTIRRTRTSWR